MYPRQFSSQPARPAFIVLPPCQQTHVFPRSPCCTNHLLQVLHLSSVFTPNLDTTFALSVAWTALQIPTCSFVIPYTLVSRGWQTDRCWWSQLHTKASSIAAHIAGVCQCNCLLLLLYTSSLLLA